jgi:hypothetical protein
MSRAVEQTGADIVIAALSRAPAVLAMAFLLGACDGAAPTATPLPTNTRLPPTVTPPPPTTTPLPPTATATRPATVDGAVMLDTEKKCQVTLPASFTPDATGDGNATSSDGNAFLNLTSFDTEPLGFEATTQLVIDEFSAAIDDYEETERRSGTNRGRPFTGVTFTATLVGQPRLGQFYFVQEGSTTCAISIVVLQSAASGFGDTIDALVASVQAAQP